MQPDQNVAIYGHGRFGAALAGLLCDAGLTVRAYDPHAPCAPVDARVTLVADQSTLLRDADVVVVAAPVAATRAALLTLAPELTPRQLVLDVASVKVSPQAALREVLAERIPWVATHPLFGPASLARGERPLRVVLVPDPARPEALDRARAFYQRAGCEVIEQPAEQHDQAMARSHALAFFIAKGLYDIGAGDDAVAPPSFRALQRTVDAVRADAGHLFVAIQQENPHAPAARRALIDALQSIDEELSAAAPDASLRSPEAATDRLALPDLGARSPALAQTRELIDELDHELLTLLARRQQLSRRAAEAKAAIERGVHDPAREASLLADRSVVAERLGLDPAGVRRIFEAVMLASRQIQRAGEKNATTPGPDAPKQ
jgi:prephenate dehydrogenase